MGDEVKKISFGFSKLSKKPSIVPSQKYVANVEKNDIELIDCLEGKSIKLKEPRKCEKSNILVIPLKKESEDLPVLSEDVNTKTVQVKVGEPELQVYNLGKQVSNNTLSTSCQPTTLMQTCSVLYGNKDVKSCNPPECQNLTLDEIAAREIIEESSSKKVDDQKHIFSVPLKSDPPTGEKESTIDDYDNIPVNEFGMAMLRGMGWAPGKGIGKNEKSVTVKLPSVRPKGMGLGADTFIKEATSNQPSDKNLKMVKGSFIRVAAGPHKDSYGQIEGFDEESGRLIVKLSLKNVSVSLNEFIVSLVDKTEFSKNSKVINVAKYEQYKHEKSEIPLDQERLEKSEDKLINQDRNYEQSLNKPKLNKHKQYPSISENDAPVGKNLTHKSTEKLYNGQSKSEGDFSSRDKFASSIYTDKPSNSKDKDYIYKTSSVENSYKPVERSSKRQKYSSESSGTTSLSDNCKRKERTKEKKYKDKSRTRSSSSNNSTSSSSTSCRKERSRTKKKKPSSHKYKSRSRSRSPRKRSSHKKHKKSSCR